MLIKTVLLLLFLFLFEGSGFQLRIPGRKLLLRQETLIFVASTNQEINRTIQETPCYWKPNVEGSRWQRRIHLEDLKAGQVLTGFLVQELLKGKTGPKLFFDVGVGSTDSNGNWKIVNAMLRLDRGKESVTKKRAARIRSKSRMELYVSRIFPECGRLEVCQKEEDLEKYAAKEKVSMSSLSLNQEVIGSVVQLRPYGAMVDIGTNRLGLLHIQRVADLYGKYINKEAGLKEAGLERGARVRLCVNSIKQRRISLDFTEDVKEDARLEREATGTIAQPAPSPAPTESSMSNSELAEWAEFASNDQMPLANTHAESSADVGDEDDDENKDDDSYDRYDEERDIEDSLGLGFY